MRTALLLLALAACGGQATANECATPSRVVSCDEQPFYTFTLASTDGSQPTWHGSTCTERPCASGDSCEVAIDGTFAEGVCR